MMINKNVENTLVEILQELRLIREHLVPPAPMTDAELAQNLTKVLGTGPEGVFNK
jgi:hypothetical protein